jgi:chromosomal replication initiator protein
MNIITVNIIVNIVAKYFSIQPEEILTGSREQHIARPRQIAMYLSFKYTGWSQGAIAKEFGKHRTDVVHACKKVKNKEEYRHVIYDMDRVLMAHLEKEYIISGQEKREYKDKLNKYKDEKLEQARSEWV